MDIPIDVGFKVGGAIGGGDCFFDAVSQGLCQLNVGNIFRIRYLRELCKHYAQEKCQTEGSWLKAALNHEGQTVEYYIRNIKYCSMDFQDGKTPNDLKNPIWGRPEIEGRMICDFCKIKLHLIEKHVMDMEEMRLGDVGKNVSKVHCAARNATQLTETPPIAGNKISQYKATQPAECEMQIGKCELWIHQIVDKTGSKSVSDVRYDAHDTIHILNEGDHHFKPILRVNHQTLPSTSGAIYVTQEHLRKSEGIDSKPGTVHYIPQDETNQIAIEDVNLNMKPKYGERQVIVPLHLHALDTVYAKVYEDVPLGNLVEALYRPQDGRMFAISGIRQTEGGAMKDELVEFLRVPDPRVVCEVKQRVCSGSVVFLPNERKEDAVQNYRQICYENRDKVVYWVEVASGGKVQLLQVYDPKFYLKRLFSSEGGRNADLRDEAKFCEKNAKVVILTYKSGMGISTTLASLASQLTQSNWVIRVNIEDCAKAVAAVPLWNHSDELSCEDVYTFLSHIEGTGFPNHELKELFCCQLDEEEQSSIVMLFDGFAKVSGDQELKIVQLLKFLRKYTSARIWVSTTPDKETYLEVCLNASGKWLEDVSDDERAQYLYNFWRVRFGLTYKAEVLENRLATYSKDLLHKAMQILYQNMPLLVASPLLLRIFAEGFQSEVLKRCRNSSTFTDICKEFINERCRIVAKEETWYQGMCFGYDDCSKYLEADCNLKILQQKCPIHVQEFREVIVNFNDRLATNAEMLVAAVEGNYAKIISTPRDGSGEFSEDLQGRTALHLVALYGHYNVVSVLLDLGYDAFKSDASGRTPLHYAVMGSHYHVIHLLTRYNADIDINDHIFATTFDANVVIGDSIFLDSKYAKSKLVTWVNKEDNHGKTCLYYAAFNGDWRSCCTLLLNGASICDLGIDEKKKLLTYITDVSADSHYPLCALLLADVPNVLNELADQIPRNQVWKDFCNFCAIDSDYLTLLKRAFCQGHVGVIDAIFGRIKQNFVKSKLLGFIDKKGKLLEVNNYNAQLSDCERLNTVRYCVEFHNNKFYNSLKKVRNVRSAARYGHIETLKYYLGKAGYEWVKPYVMHEAIDANNAIMVDYLWKNYRTEIVSCPPNHNTVLHMAAKKGKLNIVKYLVRNGADVNAVNLLGETPVHHAVDSSHLDVVKYLLANGSHFDMRDYCEQRLNEESAGNLLYDATGEVDVVKCLLAESKLGFDWKESKCGELIREVHLGNVNGADEDGATVLQKAAAMMPASFVRYLVAHGANVYPANAKGETALHFAAQNEKGHKEVAKVLLANGATYDLKDYENKKTASYYMKLHKNIAAIPLLEFIDSMFSNVNRVKFTNLDREDQEAVFNARNHKLNTVLHLAADANRMDVVEFVLKEDMSSRRAGCLNSLNEWQNTPLHVACSKGHIEIVKLFLRKGAFFDSTNFWDQTPKDLAGESGHKDIVQLLQLVEDLFAATKRDELVTVEKKIGKGYVDVKDKCGKTMLHWASQHGCVDTAKLLLKNGANVGARDVNSWTPLHYAANFSQKQICAILFEYGAMFDTVNGDRLTANDVDESGSCVILNSVSCLFADIKDGYLQAALLFLIEIERNKPDYLLAIISVRDSSGNTLLHVAACCYHYDVTLYLLKLGAAYNAKNLKGETPEALSLYKHVKLLLKLINQLFDWKSKLIYTLREIEEDYLEELKVIRDVRDVYGRTILHAAANVKPLDYFRLNFFVINGANVNAKDRKARSVLDYAIHFENLEFVTFLLKNGAFVSSVNLENKKKVIAMASYYGRQDVADLFA